MVGSGHKWLSNPAVFDDKNDSKKEGEESSGIGEGKGEGRRENLFFFGRKRGEKEWERERRGRENTVIYARERAFPRQITKSDIPS